MKWRVIMRELERRDDGRGGMLRLTNGGMSHVKGGRERAADDMKKDWVSFWTSFVGLNELLPEIEFYSINLEDAIFCVKEGGLYAAREHLPLNELEQLVITVLHATCSNSALGGLRRSYSAPTSVRELKAKATGWISTVATPEAFNLRYPQLQQAPPIEVLTPADVEAIKTKLQHSVELICDDGRKRWKAQSSRPIENVPFEEVRKSATNFRLNFRGKVDLARIQKDITHEEHFGHSTFYGLSNGRAPKLLEVLCGFLFDLTDLPRDSEDWISGYGCFVDLWAIILVHKDLVLAILLIVRYLKVIETPFVMVHSSKVSSQIAMFYAVYSIDIIILV